MGSIPSYKFDRQDNTAIYSLIPAWERVHIPATYTLGIFWKRYSYQISIYPRMYRFYVNLPNLDVLYIM